MAAAAGKKSTTSPSLFMEAYGPMESRAERSLDEADSRDSNVEAVGGLAGAVMCETRGLGIKWPYWHSLLFGNDIKIDIRSHFGSRYPHQDSFRVRILFAVYIAWPLLLVALPSIVGNLVVLDLVRSL